MFKSIFSISLIFVFLVGITGINLDTHYCCGEVIKSEFSIYPKTLSCGMSMDKAPVRNDNEESFSTLCCENEHLSFQVDNDYLKYNKHAQYIPQMDIVPVDIELATEFTCNQPKYEEMGYSPPPIDRDIVVLVQSFLI